MLSLNELSVFLEAADCGNFSETGRNLHLSQPAISQKIENLQKHFGTKLFVRDGRSMRLTESGMALRPLAKELIAAARRIDETMVSLQGEIIGEMTIGCSTASGKYLLPGLIASFRKIYPNVRINVNVTSRQSVFNKLLGGDVALGISSKKIPHKDLDYKKFFRDDVILIAPTGHPWERVESIKLEELMDEPIILREEGAGTRDVYMKALLDLGFSPDMLNVAMELGNTEAIEMAVEQKIGVAFISRLAAERGMELGYIAEVEVQGLDLTRDIFLTRRKRSPSTRAQIKFWNFVDSSILKFENNIPVVECEQISV